MLPSPRFDSENPFGNAATLLAELSRATPSRRLNPGSADFERLEALLPRVLDSAATRNEQCLAARELWAFLLDLAGTKIEAGLEVSAAPARWLYVFRKAFNQGLIGPIVWGAIIRFL
ncbi:hypothetical protein [Sphingomonas psychrolutea]|uniref:hypothetical protein n=1 Tax=Sphingomonas psychrolutea TaxID=1259676 RepID=UPI00166809DA|nr:hypothetical protein [Sphingomonas psychrolutea]